MHLSFRNPTGEIQNKRKRNNKMLGKIHLASPFLIEQTQSSLPLLDDV